MARKAGPRTFVVTGVKEIDKKLQRLSNKDSKKIIRKALRSQAKVVQSEIKSRAPVGKTGQVKKNVKVRAAKRSTLSIGVNVQIGAGDFVGDQYYAAFVEYGTKHMPARSFMRAAFDAKKNEAKRALENEITKGIEESIKRR